MLTGGIGWAQETTRPTFETEAEVWAEVERLKAEPMPVTTQKQACAKTGVPAALFAPANEAKSLSQAAQDELFVRMEEFSTWDIIDTEIVTMNLEAILPPEAIGQYRKAGDWCTAPVLEISEFGTDSHIFNMTSNRVIDDNYFRWRGESPRFSGSRLSFSADQLGHAKGTYQANGLLFFIRHLDDDQYLLVSVGAEHRPIDKVRTQKQIQKDVEHVRQKSKKTSIKEKKEIATLRNNTVTALVIGLEVSRGFLDDQFDDGRDLFLNTLARSEISNVSLTGVGFHNIRHIDFNNTPIALLAAVIARDDVVRALWKDSGADLVIFYATTFFGDALGIADPFRTTNLDIPLVVGVNLTNSDVGNTTAHEIGHVFGAGHENDSGFLKDSRAFEENAKQTIMWSERTSLSVNQFSSEAPLQIGDGDHDNARVFGVTAATLAGLGKRVSQPVAAPLAVNMIEGNCVPNQTMTYVTTWSDSPTPFTHFETAFSRTSSFNQPFDVGLENFEKFNLTDGTWNIGVRAKLGDKPSQWVSQRVFVNTDCGFPDRKPEK